LILYEIGGPVSAADRGNGPLHYEKLTDVARLIESREVSPVELTRALLERIGSVDAALKSYATVTADRAMAAADEAEKEIAAGRYRGVLHGVPIAVKDLCYTRGIATKGGLAVRRDFVPGYDATVVAKLEAAGAVLLGKLNLTEGAMAGYHPEFDIPVNPWRADYWSGASSSGSGVATAAGLCYASLGSDTGGSIRFPSMANGIVGLKPTYGRVSRYGVLPLAESLDHIGPMTRSVADAAVVFECIAGHDVRDSTTLDDPVPALVAGLDAGIEGMRIGIDREYSAAGTDPGLIDAIDVALGVLESLGAQIVELRAPAFTSARPGSAFAAMKPSWPTRRISRHAQTNTGPTSATS
jgi:amidase